MSPITPIDLEEQLSTLSILIYGYTGTGKTHIAGTAPKPLFLDFENGTPTLSNIKCEKCGRKYWLSKDNPCNDCKDLGGSAFHITDVASLRQVLDCLDLIYKARGKDDKDKAEARQWIKKKLGVEVDLDIESVVVDTLSRMQEDEIIGILDGRTTQRAETEDTMEMREWGILLTRMYRLMKRLPNQGFNIILLAQAREFEDPTEKKRKWVPNLRGQWGDQIGAYASIVGYLEVKNIMVSPGKKKAVRRLHLQPSGDFTAKSRYNMPEYLDDPTFSKIRKLVMDSRKT